jgi:hypothetical protein
MNPCMSVVILLMFMARFGTEPHAAFKSKKEIRSDLKACTFVSQDLVAKFFLSRLL